MKVTSIFTLSALIAAAKVAATRLLSQGRSGSSPNKP